MFSWLTDISNGTVDAEAMWVVISSPSREKSRSAWAALVDALHCPSTGEFTFEIDAQIGRLDDSFLVRYRNNNLQRMDTRPARVILRVDSPGELSQVRVRVDECDCGADDCEASACYELGRFIRRTELRAAA